VHCRDITFSSFVATVQGDVLAHFHAVAMKHHNIMWNWLSGMSGRILCEQALDIKKMMIMMSFTCLAFSVFISLDFLCTAYALFSERLSNHCQGLSHTFSKICTKFDAVFLSDLSQNYIRPDTRFQIKGHKNSARPPRCMKFCTLPPKMC
jgi:hypothetical protein